MNNELSILIQQLKSASTPESVFGILVGKTADDKLEEIKKIYQRLVVVAHPDKFIDPNDKAPATEAFKLLQKLYEQAEARIKSNSYGDATKASMPSGPLTITSKKSTIILKDQYSAGAIADIFHGTIEDKSGNQDVLVKLARNPKSNPFMMNESAILKHLHKDDGTGLSELIPVCLDSFAVLDSATKANRQATVFPDTTDLVSLADVITAYPDGINERDMAWMYKRMLAALHYAHSKGVIHGSVIPPHVLLNTKNHGILLIDWTQSVQDGKNPIRAIEEEYADYYPKEVFDKKVPTAATDIYMAAMTIIKILGGDVKNKKVPDVVQKDLRLILQACTLNNSRLDSALEIHEEFNTAIRKLFGPAKFREFVVSK